MNDLEHDKNRQDQHQTPLFQHPRPSRADLAHQRRTDFDRLLDSWAHIAAASPFASYGPDATATVAAAKAALERGLTPYQTLLLHVAPAFLGTAERALEVVELDGDEAEHG